MEKVSIDGVEPGTTDDHRTHDRRALTDALNTSDVAVVHYVLEPGERFSGSFHTHMDQEEIFLVVEGEATFETRAPDTAGTGGEEPSETREITVEEGEAIRFAPGEYQTGWNDGDETVVAYALGGPRDSTDVRIAHIAGYGDVSCPECGHDSMRVDPTETDANLVCPDCGTAWGS
ncbi:MAG: cupin domain-containing protein [Haloarculaceae archaeon]